MSKNIEYFVIVDTEDYAGNFERELCAYMTGTYGECGVGEVCADLFEKDVDEETFKWFDENIMYESDDNGCSRPAKLSSTPGWFNDGNGSHYKEKNCDYEEVLTEYNKKEEQYLKTYPKATHRKLLKSVDEIQKHPAYMSVEFGFDREKPSDELLDFMTNRAHKFCTDDRVKTAFMRPPKKITAVRFVKRTTTIEDEELFRK